MAGTLSAIAGAIIPRQHALGQDWIVGEIYAAAARYGVDGDYLVNVAMCESNLDPGAVGIHGEIGIFQFMDYTFFAHGGTDIWSVADQADVAARMFANGEGYNWVCA
jgi:hypothetical protein